MKRGRGLNENEVKVECSRRGEGAWVLSYKVFLAFIFVFNSMIKIISYDMISNWIMMMSKLIWFMQLIHSLN